jgi:two-component sensor histidine kinase
LSAEKEKAEKERIEAERLEAERIAKEESDKFNAKFDEKIKSVDEKYTKLLEEKDKKLVEFQEKIEELEKKMPNGSIQQKIRTKDTVPDKELKRKKLVSGFYNQK